MSRGRKLSDDEVAELAELRARNLEELRELQEDVERRKKVVILELHRPEPKAEPKTMSTLTDFQITRMIAVMREEMSTQLRDHHGFLKALISEAYSDLYRSTKAMKKEIQRLRAEVAELRGAETKAMDGGTVTSIVRKQTRS